MQAQVPSEAPLPPLPTTVRQHASIFPTAYPPNTAPGPPNNIVPQTKPFNEGIVKPETHSQQSPTAPKLGSSLVVQWYFLPVHLVPFFFL